MAEARCGPQVSKETRCPERLCVERASGSRPPCLPWTTREEAVLREHYPRGGLGACLALLPERTDSAISGRASKLGLRHKADYSGLPKRRYSSSSFIDEAIRDLYLHHPERGAMRALCERLGRPRHWVQRRGRQLGLVRPRWKEPDWQDAEIEILAAHAHQAPETIARYLRAAGYRRTTVAIDVKRKRLACCDTHDPDHYTATGLARVLGIDPKSVTRWIHIGELRARRRGTKRLPQQGGDQHWIHWRDAQAFIAGDPDRIDLRKVDRADFIALLVRRQ
ncbi:MAG: hypothetical protein IT495_17135 [Gammaproteobacteria bacterium]|nr:hypothetical protein [Gammaproteobacteria bacterium]